jgi:hypothetical protein
MVASYLKSDLRIQVLHRNFLWSVVKKPVLKTKNLGKELNLHMKLCPIITRTAGGKYSKKVSFLSGTLALNALLVNTF